MPGEGTDVSVHWVCSCIWFSPYSWLKRQTHNSISILNCCVILHIFSLSTLRATKARKNSLYMKMYLANKHDSDSDSLSLCSLHFRNTHKQKQKNTILHYPSTQAQDYYICLLYPHQQHKNTFLLDNQHCHNHCILYHRVRPILLSVTTPLLVNMFSI